MRAHAEFIYREIIRDTVPVWAFKILNLTFISFIQSVLLFSLAAPVYPILLSIQFQPDVTYVDMLFLAFELGLLTTEYIADEQQWGRSHTFFHRLLQRN